MSAIAIHSSVVSDWNKLIMSAARDKKLDRRVVQRLVAARAVRARLPEVAERARLRQADGEHHQRRRHGRGGDERPAPATRRQLDEEHRMA